MDRQLRLEQHWDEEMRRKYSGVDLAELATVLRNSESYTRQMHKKAEDTYFEFIAWWYFTDNKAALEFDANAYYIHTMLRPRHLIIFDLDEEDNDT